MREAAPHFGFGSVEHAAPLSNLGVLFASKGDSAAAERAFRDSRSALERVGARSRVDWVDYWLDA